jgi:hypothetical protein
MRLVLLLFLTGTAVASARVVKETRKIEKQFRFTPGGQIVLTADEGDIRIVTWDRDEVHLTMTKVAYGRDREEAEDMLKMMEVDIRESGDRLFIEEGRWREEYRFNFWDLFDGDFWRGRGRRTAYIDFDLKVPENVNLRLVCDEGDVEISETRGELLVNVDEGDIYLDDIVSDRVIIEVDEGDLVLRGFEDSDSGIWEIRTDEGDLTLDSGRIHELNLYSDEGEILLTHTDVYQMILETDEGDISADFQPAQDGRYKVTTDEGNLSITLPAGCDLDVLARTMDGSIRCDFPIEIDREGDGSKAKGQLGSGGGEMRLYTDEGHLEIKKR